MAATWQYSCRMAERNNPDLNARQFVEVKPTAAYCPLCGWTLFDYGHDRIKRSSDPLYCEEHQVWHTDGVCPTGWEPAIYTEEGEQ